MMYRGRRGRGDERRHRRTAVGRGARRQPALGLHSHGRRHALHGGGDRRRRSHSVHRQDWIDPVLSLLIAALILWSSIGIVRETLNILLEGTPRGVALPQIRAGMEEVEGVDQRPRPARVVPGLELQRAGLPRHHRRHSAVGERLHPGQAQPPAARSLPHQPHHHPVRARGLRRAGGLRGAHGRDGRRSLATRTTITATPIKLGAGGVPSCIHSPRVFRLDFLHCRWFPLLSCLAHFRTRSAHACCARRSAAPRCSRTRSRRACSTRSPASTPTPTSPIRPQLLCAERQAHGRIGPHRAHGAHRAFGYGVRDSRLATPLPASRSTRPASRPASPFPTQQDAIYTRTGAAVHHVFHDYHRTEVMIPMRDGVKLHAVILKPADIPAPLPFLLERTPYGVDGTSRADIFAAAARSWRAPATSLWPRTFAAATRARASSS